MPEAIVPGHKQMDKGSVIQPAAKEKAVRIIADLQGIGNQVEVIPYETALQSRDVDGKSCQDDYDDQQNSDFFIMYIHTIYENKGGSVLGPPVSIRESATVILRSVLC